MGDYQITKTAKGPTVGTNLPENYLKAECGENGESGLIFPYSTI
jgi:hypothetical protein